MPVAGFVACSAQRFQPRSQRPGSRLRAAVEFSEIAAQVGYGAVETVLHRTQLRTLGVEVLHGTVQYLDGLLSAGAVKNAQVGDGAFHFHSGGGAVASQTQRSQTSTAATVGNSNIFIGEQVKRAASCCIGPFAGSLPPVLAALMEAAMLSMSAAIRN